MDIAATPTLALACELIARRSTTPDDAGCQALLAERLAPLGFRCETTIDNGVTNLWARLGDAKPLLCLAGHTDVVPTGPLDGWDSDPFVPEVRDGYLYGRGAADMKGSLAAFVVAVEGFLADCPRPSGSIALLITSDEEGASVDGTVRVVERLAKAGTQIDYCVVGEPSSETRLGDTIKNGRRGTLSGTLTVRGVQGHIAYPQLARNPIHLAVPALAELAAMHWDDGNEYFPPTSFQISNIHAGTGAGNVIPGTLEVMFNFRYSTQSTRDSLAARLTAVLDRHRLDYAIAWTGHGEPFLTPRGRLVAVATESIREVVGVSPGLSCAGGTSDGRFIARICPEVAEIGPVNATIHKLNERVLAADLESLAAIYRSLLQRLLGAAA
ncbi:MAG TPA: succinyl-diaminopimelate desuccinylase [Casimicrobiaceae bacterium]|nr:succinyl-diaminopimelate desuccinylase [Casimicrobiaceae bacterium]